MKAINIRPVAAVKPVSIAPRFSARNQMRVGATKFNATPRLVVQKRFYADTWSDREQGIENFTVRKHDEELMRKLREAEEARAKAEARAQVFARISEVTSKAAEEKSGGPVKEKELTDFVSMHEFLEFRKELVERIRDLEDEIHKLQVSKYEKKKFF